MRKLFLFALLLMPFAVKAQVPAQITGAGAPSGSCTSTQQYLDTTAHNLYYCNNGTWSSSQGIGNQTGGGGTGLTQVAALPGTCTAGTTQPVQLTVAPYAIYTCTSTNTWTASSSITGTTAGFGYYVQGATSASTAPCNVATTICEQAPAAVTSYVVTKPGTAAQGVITNALSGSVITQGFSGDTNHSATVTTGSATSIGSTQLCSTANCPAGTYRVNVYIDITTACGTSGTYVVNLIYTDDQGSKTIPVNLSGTGSVPATGVLTTTSTANFGESGQIIRSTGAASINYSTTAVACGTAGPMVGKLYLSVEQLQ